MRPEIAHVSNMQHCADELERLVDAYTLSTVCEALSFVCSEKAEHLRVNWQDAKGADEWDHMAGVLLGADWKAAQRNL